MMKRLLLFTTCVVIALPWQPLPLQAAPRKHCDDTRSVYRCDDFATSQHDLTEVWHLPKKNTKFAGPGGVPGYAFNIISIRHSSWTGRNQIKSEPFGVYANLQECDVARADKIHQLDAVNARFPHLPENPHERVTHLQGGSVIVEKEGWERTDVTYCEPGIYSPGGGPPNGMVQNDIQTTGAAARASVEITPLEVAPGFVRHWVAPRPFTRAIPGTSDVVEILVGNGRELVFMVKPDVALPPATKTNILLIDDNGEVIANLRITTPARLNGNIQNGPDGMQFYRKDNPNYVPPKEKK